MQPIIKFFVTTSIILAFSTPAFAESDLKIDTIRKEYAAIQKMKSGFTKEKRDIPDESTEAGEAIVYRDKNGKIRIIEKNLMFEGGNTNQEFYFKDEKPIFTLIINTTYNAPIYMDKEHIKQEGLDMEPFDIKKSKISKNRYYFDQQKLIRWVDDQGKQVSPSDPEFKKEEKSLLDNIGNMLAEAAKRK